MIRPRYAVVAALALALPSAASAASPLLYSITAGGSVVTRAGGQYAVSIPASSNAVWFTDRPARTSGIASAGGVVDGWRTNAFDADPPNAAILMTRRGKTTQVVGTLTAGVRRGDRVVFTARPVRGMQVAGHRASGFLRPGRHGRTEIFIDDGTVPPCGYHYRSATSVDCTLSPGDEWVSLQHGGAWASGVSLSITSDPAGVSVAFHRSWLYSYFCGSPPQLCAGSSVSDETATTPITRTYDAATGGTIRSEEVRVGAPAAGSSAVRVTIARR